MAKRIKIFKTNKTPSDLENEVNSWLQENPNVINIFPSGLSTTPGTVPVLIVFYETQTDDMGQALEIVKRQNERITLFEIVDYSVDGLYYRDFMEDLSEWHVNKNDQIFFDWKRIDYHFDASRTRTVHKNQRYSREIRFGWNRC